jgi:hypothetical protein
MPNLRKSHNRDRKIEQRRYGHQVDNRSIFVIQELEREKAIRIKREREEKERSLETA